MVRHQAQASDYSLFGSKRGGEYSLRFWGNFSAPRMYQRNVCVCVRERENGEGKVSLCDEILKSLPEFPDLLEERESVSAQSVSFLSPAFTYRIMLDLPGFSWGSTRQKGALLSAAHEHEDVS